MRVVRRASTKSGKGRRVRLTRPAVTALKDHHKRQLEERMRFSESDRRSAREGSRGEAGAKRILPSPRRKHRKRQAGEKLAYGPNYQDSGLVFTDEGGGKLPPWKSERIYNQQNTQAFPASVSTT